MLHETQIMSVVERSLNVLTILKMYQDVLDYVLLMFTSSAKFVEQSIDTSDTIC